MSDSYLFDDLEKHLAGATHLNKLAEARQAASWRSTLSLSLSAWLLR